jgi:hypothetical protein
MFRRGRPDCECCFRILDEVVRGLGPATVGRGWGRSVPPVKMIRCVIYRGYRRTSTREAFSERQTFVRPTAHYLPLARGEERDVPQVAHLSRGDLIAGVIGEAWVEHSARPVRAFENPTTARVSQAFVHTTKASSPRRTSQRRTARTAPSDFWKGRRSAIVGSFIAATPPMNRARRVPSQWTTCRERAVAGDEAYEVFRQPRGAGLVRRTAAARGCRRCW